MYVLFALLALLCGCAFGPPPAARSAPGMPPAPLTAVTFNIGVAPGSVPLSLERVPAIAQAIAATPFDVMCIQEAWLPETRAALQSALALPPGQFVHFNTAGQNESGRDWCRAGEVDLPLACVQSNCPGLSGDAMTACAKANCKPQLFLTYARNPGCVHCLVSSTGLSVPDMVRQCTRPPGSSRIYGGNNGVVLVSRIPLRNVEGVSLPSSLSNRVAVLASVQPAGWSRSVEVGCMHSSASAPLPPTSGFISWHAEKREQLRMVIDRLEERAPESTSLLLGDLNAGPDWLSGHRDSHGVFAMATVAGYREPLAALGMPFCSACRSSSFRGPTETERLIDHVLFRQPRGGRGFGPRLHPLGATRLFDQVVRVPDGRGGWADTNLSDHYGVSVTFGFGR